MKPDEFWSSTLDEVMLMVMGKVDDWRIRRIAAFKIVEGYRGSKDMPSVYDFLSLPFDDELKNKDEADMEQLRSDAQAVWNEAQASGYIDSKWWENDVNKN